MNTKYFHAQIYGRPKRKGKKKKKIYIYIYIYFLSLPAWKKKVQKALYFGETFTKNASLCFKKITFIGNLHSVNLIMIL